MRKVIIEMIVDNETKEENSFEQKRVKRKRKGISLRQGERALFEKWAKRARKREKELRQKRKQSKDSPGQKEDLLGGRKER